MNCRWMVMFVALFVGRGAVAQMDNAQMTVWVNEAIVSTYTYNYSNLLQREKEFAKYFTAGGWIAYSQALTSSKLSVAVAKNKYSVSAVATMPPEIKKVRDHQWTAVMPVLVLYKNSNKKQTQILKVVLSFMDAPSGEGVRGLAITSLDATDAQPPCTCMSGSRS